MRLGVDIDGVLTDIEQLELDYGSRYYLTSTNRHLKKPDGYGSDEIFDASNEEDCDFWGMAIYDYVNEPPRRFASEVLNKLKTEGVEIFIITNRVSDLSYCDITIEEMKRIIVKWLKKHKIPYDQLIFTEGTKLTALRENKIDVMVEDSPKMISEIAKEFKVFCFDERYNQKLRHENMTRVFSWYDIYDKIKGLY